MITLKLAGPTPIRQSCQGQPNTTRMTSARQLIRTGCCGSRAADPRRRVVTNVPDKKHTRAKYESRTKVQGTVAIRQKNVPTVLRLAQENGAD